VDAQVLPWQLCRVLHGEDLELILVDGDLVAARLDVGLQIAENRVVLEQMRQGRGIRQVVDRDEVDLAAARRRAHDVATDAAESVDTNFDSHLVLRHASARVDPRTPRVPAASAVNVALTEGKSQGPTAGCSASSRS